MRGIASFQRPGAIDATLSAGDDLDPASIRELYDHFGPMLERHATRNGAADPEGVANLALYDGVRAFGNLRSRTERSFRSYIFRAASSRIASEKRKGSLDLTVLGDQEPICPEAGIDEATVDASLVADLLESLSEDQRKVIHDRFFIGYTAVETAVRLGKSPGAVRKLQHDAIARLRRSAFVIGVAGFVFVALFAMADAGSTSRIGIEPPAGESDRVQSPTSWQPDPSPPRSIEITAAERADKAVGLTADAVEGSSIPTSTAPPISAAPTSSAATGTTTVGGGGPTSPVDRSSIAETTIDRSGPNPQPEIRSAPPAAAECELNEREFEIESGIGRIPHSYRLFADDGSLLGSTIDLVEHDPTSGSESRKWKSKHNQDFQPILVHSVAAVSSSGQQSGRTVCEQERTRSGNDDDDDNQDDDGDNDHNDDSNDDDDDNEARGDADDD